MSREPLIARHHEKNLLNRALESQRAEFVAVYGRRRVGKTFLVRAQLDRPEYKYFQLTGVHRGRLREQLQNFADAWQRTFGVQIPQPASWHETFRFIRSSLEAEMRQTHAPVVFFFDELPWLCGKNHRFLSALEHFWNDWGERQAQLKLVVCGSAASWMVKRVVRARGGLHNRLTRRIHLQSFTVREVVEYLRTHRIRYTPYDIIKLYMVFGGVPFYLKQLERGCSVDQNIQALCFDENGPLATELDDVFDSLFSAADIYKAVVRRLAQHHHGVTRRELIASVPQSSGGGLTQILENLEASGFIHWVPAWSNAARDARIQLFDEYSRFALRFVRGRSRGDFSSIAKSPAFRTWSGLAFETFCLRHVDLLRESLGIQGVQTRAAQYRFGGRRHDEGLQIDLLLDRDDSIVDLCEMKFSASPFIIDKRYAEQLRHRLHGFVRATRTRKTPHHVFVTVNGVEANRYRHELVDREVRFCDLLA